MKFKLEKIPSKTLLGLFVLGSYLLLLIGLSVSTGILGLDFVKRESDRSALLERQIKTAFALQHNEMSEEMWTSSYEAILLRTEKVMQQFGRAAFSVVLFSSDGKCVYSSGIKCEDSNQLSDLLPSRPGLEPETRFIQYVEKADRLLYASALGVGTTIKGYLYVSFEDPYHYYRGDMPSLVSSVLLPLFIMLGVAWALWLLFSYRSLLRPYFEHLSKMEKEKALGNLARQVGHDIRNPLSALEKVCSITAGIPEKNQLLIGAAIRQIRDISNNLLTAKEKGNESHPPSIVSVSRLLSLVTSQMRIRYKGNGVQLEFQESNNSVKAFAFIDSSNLQRALSNLIDNAVEACLPKGQVRIHVTCLPGFVVIAITDTGRGIPPEVLPYLGQRGATFNKGNGNGLGLYFAKQVIKKAGGDLTIISKVGEGTKVDVRLPATPDSSPFLDRLQLAPKTNVLIIDDDATSFETWKNRLSSFDELKVQHMSEPSIPAIRDFLKTAGPVLVICDYDLGKENLSGMDLLLAADANSRAVLSTHHADDPELIRRCYKENILLLPKEWVDLIDVQVDSETRKQDEGHH